MKKLLLPVAAAALALAAFTLPLSRTSLAVAEPVVFADPNTTDEVPQDHKLVVYQLLPRLFGNKTALNKPYGTVQENGTGKFNDLTDKALQELKKMGVSHVWYTGVLEHATMTDYRKVGGPGPDDADVVKGRAGSPYAIRDYYDVDPDLAVSYKTRMAEFEALVKRTHANGLKLLIDFIPNHVARTYKSDAKPAGVIDLGAVDDQTKAFAPSNNFYYLPDQTLTVPKAGNPLGAGLGPKEDGKFAETPAKATGNDVFTATPKVDDWYETIKLNYGVDYQNERKTYFQPVPNTWKKMRDILVYWAQKDVDGFRCDVAEMVPVEFWAWVIPEVKKVKPDVIFLAEAYSPKEYKTYLDKGKFDFLYDKVGLYDALRRLMTGTGNTEEITKVWKEESRGFSSRMLRFLENHDEQRIASQEFATDPRTAIPAMTVAATLASGPVMLYSGQEVGEAGKGVAGFNTGDGRTTIFDYWGAPEHQKWMNGGKFDGGKLDESQKQLRDFYGRLLNLASTSEAIRKGRFYELQDANNLSKDYDHKQVYSYLRYTDQQRLLVVVNFSRDKTSRPTIDIPREVRQRLGLNPDQFFTYTDLLNNTPPLEYLTFELPPLSAYVFEIKPK